MSRRPATLGMLGGGQLGRMSGMAARQMGFGLTAAARHRDGPCGQVADQVFITDFSQNLDALAAKVAQASDVATYEWENVPAALARSLAERIPVRPSPDILETAQDRLLEKARSRDCGAATTAFAAVEHAGQLEAALAAVGLPAVLKTTRGGYDGKGQAVVHTAAEVHAACRELGTAERTLILEAFVPFQKELSVIVARSVEGEVRAFPVVENIHRHGILHLTLAPARVSAAVAQEAREVARRLAVGLNLVGVMGVELFLVDGKVLVNELAPRPHNSGHYSLDACLTSQFEQHVRAATGLPLGAPDLLTPAVMLNILGQHLSPLLAGMSRLLQRDDRLKVHLYGKADARPDRKMGHVCALADDVEAGVVRLQAVWRAMAEDEDLITGTGGSDPAS